VFDKELLKYQDHLDAIVPWTQLRWWMPTQLICMFSITYRNCPINITYVIDPKLVFSLGPPIILNKFWISFFFLANCKCLRTCCYFSFALGKPSILLSYTHNKGFRKLRKWWKFKELF
jgi:hypothetical protein